MNSRGNTEIYARNEARAGCPTPPFDQRGRLPLGSLYERLPVATNGAYSPLVTASPALS